MKDSVKHLRMRFDKKQTQKTYIDSKKINKITQE